MNVSVSGDIPDLSKSTFRVFEACAGLYLTEDTHWGCDLDLIRYVLSDYASPTVLDVGCGPGWHLMNLGFVAPHVAKAMGLDYSPRMLDVARATVALSPIADRIELHQGDALQMPFPDHSFDNLICLNNTLGNLTGGQATDAPEARRRAMMEIDRVLRPAGSIVLSVYDAGRFDPGSDAYGKMFLLDEEQSDGPRGDYIVRFDPTGDLYYSHWFAPDEIESLLDAVRLRLRILERRMTRIVVVATKVSDG